MSKNLKMAKNNDKNNKITGWRSFWNNLDYGPRGALIGLVLAVGYFLVPLILRLLLVFLIILMVTLLGAAFGSLIGWIIESYKKKKKD